MGILYLVEEGAVIRRDSGRIVVCKENQEPLSIPIQSVTGVVVFPGVQITSPMTASFLESGIPVTYLSSRGKYYGRLEPVQAVNVERQLRQVDCMRDPKFVLVISRKFICAKLHNSIVILKEFARYTTVDISSVIDQIGVLRSKVICSETIEEMIGYEGLAAKHYFACIGQLVNPEFEFHGRSRSPPKDPFNSLLSYGYTLLMYDLYTMLQSHGLYPYFGFLHKPRNGHPALASDLMEEWRPVLVDAFVLHMANRGTFHVVDFIRGENGGIYLGHEQSKVFLQRYEQRVKRPKKSPEGVDEFNYRVQLEEQVIRMAKAIDAHDPAIYEPLQIR